MVLFFFDRYEMVLFISMPMGSSRNSVNKIEYTEYISAGQTLARKYFIRIRLTVRERRITDLSIILIESRHLFSART